MIILHHDSIAQTQPVACRRRPDEWRACRAGPKASCAYPQNPRQGTVAARPLQSLRVAVSDPPPPHMRCNTPSPTRSRLKSLLSLPSARSNTLRSSEKRHYLLFSKSLSRCAAEASTRVFFEAGGDAGSRANTCAAARRLLNPWRAATVRIAAETNPAAAAHPPVNAAQKDMRDCREPLLQDDKRKAE